MRLNAAMRLYCLLGAHCRTDVRMRTKPFGSTCRKKRHRKLTASSVMTRCLPPGA